ncbi:MAG TPA: DUF748 domain-containing protein [Candidatus Aquilonibacter sp.]|nr:DUF748 domain-containing protein [Candidatus Aquilonibacter sp.]
MPQKFRSWFWSRRRKFLLWIFGLLALYAVVGFLILPPIVRAIAVKQLSQQLDREVSIETIKINPFALSTTIRGLLIKDKDGQPFVSWDEVYVNFQLSSFFGKAWVFKEISVAKPFVRAQMNKDGTFNFSDLVAKFSTNAAPAKESKPLALDIGLLRITSAKLALADFTPREPFRRTVGPLDITLENFRTDPDNKNPYAFSGTTDAGEQISWSGHFYLDPLRSTGELKLFNFTLNKYAPLYQDLVRFQIRGGAIALDLNYRVEFSATNREAIVENSAFALRDFKLGAPGDSNNLVELPLLDVAGASANLESRSATVNWVRVDGGKLFLKRNKDDSVNVVQLSKPAESLTNAPGGILFLLRSVTNAVALLLQSTNQWSGTVNNVEVTNCAVHFEDLVNLRPATLDLSDITLGAKNISNLPGTNLTAEFSLRWNTNGSIKIATTASFLPPTADVQLDLDQLDLGTLDPYLEPEVNLYILGSKVGLHGNVTLRTPPDGLPEVKFHGDASLDEFRTLDGVTAEDLVRWDSIRFTGIDANLNPETVAVKKIAVNAAYARLIIETNKTINLLMAMRPAETNAPVETNAVASAKNFTTTNLESALPPISIGAIVVSNTTVSFTDCSVQPNVNLTIQDVNGSVLGISSEQLQHAIVSLDAKVDGVGPVAITGTINPFSEQLTNVINISVKDVDLTPASPYAGKFAGYRIAEGKLNMDLAYELVGTKLQSTNIITLDQFTFGEKVDSPDATHLPVRLAIAILKDRDGKIVLDVPIDGSIDDPKFRIGKVVERAILNILEKVATSPFSLIGAAFGGGEELGYQDFAPGSAALTADDTKKLGVLAKALYERPALQLEIAGSIDPAGDREGLQRAALDRQIRTRIWMNLRKSSQATNSVDQIVLSPDDRARWIKKLYDEAVANGKITPQLIAANTNLAAFAAQVLPRKLTIEKGAPRLVQSEKSVTQNPPPAASPAYQTKLVPPPDPMEAVLLATIPIDESDLETLAAARAVAVQAYLLQTGKVEASRLFLKESQTEGLRSDGSRVYLQLR